MFLEVFTILDDIFLMGTEDEIYLSKIEKEDDLIQYHMGLGRYLRNLYFWKETPLKNYLVKEKGISHPDEMSQFIIVDYWKDRYNKG